MIRLSAVTWANEALDTELTGRLPHARGRKLETTFEATPPFTGRERALGGLQRVKKNETAQEKSCAPGKIGRAYRNGAERRPGSSLNRTEFRNARVGGVDEVDDEQGDQIGAARDDE